LNYIVIDLEFNQPYDFKNNCPAKPNEACPFEIVQIGIVKLNENLEIIGRRNYYVKPQLYKRIHPYVAKMTGFSVETFENERTFQQIFKPLSRFIGREKTVFCTWGGVDIRELYRNILFYKLGCRKLPKKFIDVQKLVGRFLESGGNCVGLENAVEALGIRKTMPFHDALGDAFYAGEMFRMVKPKEVRIQRVDIKKLKDKLKLCKQK